MLRTLNFLHLSACMLVNAAVLGVVGYISFQNWHKTWDKRTVSAISLGLLTLWGGEG